MTANMTSMGNSEFVLTIFGALAQEESANTSKRVKFGKKMNAEKGRVPNIVYGYDKTIGDYFNLAINEEEAAVIRQIYKWYIEEGYGAAKIANMLNAKGIRTKRNCQWSQNATCRILTNELYTGKIINGKQEVADFLTGQRTEKDETEWMVTERPELRIIEPEMYEKAQEILECRSKTFKLTKERQSNKYLFSTLIKCKECGWSFRRTVRTYKNTYIRWVCSGHNGRGADSCPNAQTVDEEELIEVLSEYFSELLKAKKNVIRHVTGEFQRVYKAKDENLNYEKELNAQLHKLQKMRQKYMDMYTDDLITREELNEKIGGTKQEIERLENELKMVAYHLTKGEQLEIILNRTFKEIEDISDVHQMTNAQLKRIIQKIEVDKDGNVDIYLRIFGDLGLDETVLISDNQTYGALRKVFRNRRRPLAEKERSALWFHPPVSQKQRGDHRLPLRALAHPLCDQTSGFLAHHHKSDSGRIPQFSFPVPAPSLICCLLASASDVYILIFTHFSVHLMHVYCSICLPRKPAAVRIRARSVSPSAVFSLLVRRITAPIASLAHRIGCIIFWQNESIASEMTDIFSLLS